MSLPFWFNSLYLLASIFLTYNWTKNPTLNNYNLQLTAIFILAYFAYRFAFRKRFGGSIVPSTLIFTIVVLLLVFSTGQISSPLFFLINFLLFALALLFNPWQAALASIALIIIFTKSTPNPTTPQLVNIISLALTTPVAIVFGKNYLRNQASLGKISLLENNLIEDETNTLIWLSTKAKPTLYNLLETTTEIIASNRLPYYLQDRLKSLHQDLIALHQSANILEKDIQDTDTKLD